MDSLEPRTISPASPPALPSNADDKIIGSDLGELLLQNEPGSLLQRTVDMDHWRTYFETSQFIRTFLADALRDETGADLEEFNFLMTLAEAPGHTLGLSEVADKLIFSFSRLNYRVKTFVERGLITKEQSPTDRRVSQVTLTPKGLEHFTALGAVHSRHVEELVTTHLSPDELAQLAEISARFSQ